jgi:hypothetical protein
MVQQIPQSNIEKVQHLKLDPAFDNAYAQVILRLMEQVLQVTPDESFQALGAAFESGDYGYFRLSFRRDTGDSDEENALWVEYVHVRHDPEFKPQLANVMNRLGG